jgi:hypothetical protein
MLGNILSFNVGVEVGQIMALIPMYAALVVLRKMQSYNRLSLVSNLGLIFAGFYLLFIQLHRYEHDHDARHANQSASVIIIDHSASSL